VTTAGRLTSTFYQLNELDELVENCHPDPVMRKAGAVSKSARSHGRRLADQVSSKIKARARGKSKTKVLAIGTPITWKIGNIAKPSRYAAGFDKALTNRQRLKPLVNTYAKAFERSRQIGQPVTIVSEVSAGPTNEITIVIEDPASSRGATGLQEALKAARRRGAVRMAEILDREEMLSADDFAHLLGTTRVTVNAKRQKRQVLGLEGAKRGFRFPRWQLGINGKPFSALPDLFDRLGDDAWAVYRFLLQHHPELDGLTGREALEQGKSRQAIEAAESIARYSA
jgi:hypothetical protein